MCLLLPDRVEVFCLQRTFHASNLLVMDRAAFSCIVKQFPPHGMMMCDVANSQSLAAEHVQKERPSHKHMPFSVHLGHPANVGSKSESTSNTRTSHSMQSL